jgi:uncharacterized protein (TIGR03437 family)
MRFFRAAVVFVCALSTQVFGYTTYIGDAFPYQVSAIATDANGNTYITGSRTVMVSTTGNGITDIFVSKLNPSGNLTQLAILSGKGQDGAKGIAVDPAGNIYIVGMTTSPDFPLRNPLQTTAVALGSDFLYDSTYGTGFLVKLAADGAVVYSTYLGGVISSLNGVAADSQGNAYVAGTTWETDYPHTPGLPAGPVYGPLSLGGASGVFFAKISPSGDRIVYAGALSTLEHDCGTGSSCFLGLVYNSGTAIAVDPTGSAYIAGNAGGGGLPTTPGALRTDGIGAFVAKVNAAGTGLDYLTYLGSANYFPPPVAFSSSPGNLVFAIAADAEGNAYISGSTSDPAFPATPSAFQTALASTQNNPFTAPPANAFIAKLNPTGSAMVWATFLGGSGPDAANTIAPDSAGNVWVSGTTQSANFPTTSGRLKGPEFLTELNSSGSALTYSAQFPGSTTAAGLAVDSGGIVHIAGAAGLISAFPEEAAPGQASTTWLLGIANAAGGSLGGRLAPGEVFSLYGMGLGPDLPLAGAFDAAGFLPTTLGGVQVTVGGTAAPLLYVSSTQINAVAPVELSPHAASELQVTLNGSAAPKFRIFVDPTDIEVFQNPDGPAAAINQDGTVNSQAHPAPAGSYVSIWATGTGYFPGSDGQQATAANSFCGPICEVIDAYSGSPVSTPYVGAAPYTVNGVVQINFQVSGDSSGYYLRVNGANSGVFGLYVKP